MRSVGMVIVLSDDGAHGKTVLIKSMHCATGIDFIVGGN